MKIESMGTRAVLYLQKNHIPFEVVTYAHEKKGADYAAEATGFPLEQTIKTLVVDLGAKAYALVLVPGNKQLSLKHLAHAVSVKRAAMADQATAERLTGYLVGGISPFGTRQRFRVVMEKCLLAFDCVLINAGQRGVMLKMRPQDIVDVLDCAVFSVTQT